MLNNKECNQAEELSQCLDHVNDGRRPMIQDEEIKELVAVADLVKQSYSQGEIPQLLINELVDTLASELKAEARRKRRTHWLYGGATGIVAAVVLAAFMQFILPQSANNNNIAQQFDDHTEKQNSVAIAEQVRVPIIAEGTKTKLEPQDQSDSSPVAVPVEKKNPVTISQAITEIIQVVESPVAEQKTSSLAMLQQESLQDRTRKGSIVMAKKESASLQENKISLSAGKLAIMELPQQTPQSITVDDRSGVIRQVYKQGTADEIIITQRLVAESLIKPKEDVKQGEKQAVTESPALQIVNTDTENISNSLTVKVDKYYITIEGKKTKEDLRKIAESLTMVIK